MSWPILCCTWVSDTFVQDGATLNGIRHVFYSLRASSPNLNCALPEELCDIDLPGGTEESLYEQFCAEGLPKHLLNPGTAGPKPLDLFEESWKIGHTFSLPGTHNYSDGHSLRSKWFCKAMIIGRT